MTRILSLVLALVVLGLLTCPAPAQRNAKIPDPDPEIERKSFKVPEGFEVNLFASDPLLAKPIQMCFDPAGRLWLACSEAYPQIKPGQKQNDKILVLEDTRGTGKADKVTVFAEGLLIPTGIEVGDGGVYVVDSTDLLHLKDTDGDGKADRRRVVLSGFGTEDTHHMVHSLRWGPDGNLYFNQSIYIHSHIETPHGVRRLGGGGIWQFRPDTLKLEVFARGWVNPWGHHFDRFGQSFVTDGAGGEGINYVVPGASYPTAVGASRILHGLNPGSPKYCGAEIVSGRHLPDDWQGNIITNDFRAHRVCRFTLHEDGSGFAARQQTDLIRATHPAFRPVDVKMGPDGAIYIADWYNPIIQHGEVDFRDPRRDHTRGRIWRITAKNRPLVKRPQLVNARVEELLEHLKAPEDWTRHMARRVLRERGARAVLPALDAWARKLDAKKPQDEVHLLEALWTYQTLDRVESALLTTLLNARDGRVRAAAVRVAGAWADRLKEPVALLTPRVVDEHPRVRLEAVRALAGIRSLKSAETVMRALQKPIDGFLDYALWQTARELKGAWLPPLQKGEVVFGNDVQALTFALRATGASEGIRPLVELLRAGKVPRERQDSVLSLLAALGNPQDLGMVLDLVVREKASPRSAVLLEGLAQAAQTRNVRPAGNLNRLAPLLEVENESVQAAAVRLAGLWKLEGQRKALNTLVEAGGTRSAVRRAGMEALVALGGPASRKTLEDLASSSKAHEIRRLAVVALAELDLQTAARKAAEVLSASPAEADPTEIFAVLLRQQGGAAALTTALQNRKLPADVAKVGLRVVRASGREEKSLVQALTTAGSLTTPLRTLTPNQLREFIADVQEKGDAARGEKVYRRKDQACLSCHAIGGAGGQVGPDLSSIGASAPVDYLVESLLLPNKAVKEGYHSVTLTTKRGKIITGVKVRQTGTDLILRTAEDQEVSIPLRSIERQEQGKSLMPEGLTDDLTRAELVDLVRFLAALGKGEYQLGKERLVRRWQVLEATQPAQQALAQSPAGVAQESSWQTWGPAYSTVAGLLPLEAMPSIKGKAVVRCQVEVTTPGKVKLVFNAVDGLQAWLDGESLTLAREMSLDLLSGTRTLTLLVDLSQRKTGLRVELVDLAGSPAQVRVVGGK